MHIAPDSLPWPPSPAEVPPALGRPSPRYVWRARAAFVGLVACLLVYGGLVAWFVRVAWRWIAAALDPNDDNVLGFLYAVPALIVVFFLVKGLFSIQKGDLNGVIEVKEADQPQLYAFIHRIADEAGAPRPHRVFLSPGVNAAVFYDISIWNLLLPTHKNLELGMGLIQSLTLDELKAVVAHEFGHFSQKTMRVSAWVYLAGQVIGDLVHRRDGFDRLLDGLSRLDLRFAWMAWLMRLLIWSIRALLDTCFVGVVLLQRALSREMEFQADLVSVRMAGSDSLVHALHRLPVADEVWRRAVQWGVGERSASRGVADLYAVQSHLLLRLREVNQDPNWGATPARPPEAAAHRLLARGFAEAPQMWSTHPSSKDREENAKQIYVASALDARPANCLLQDLEGLHKGLTLVVLSQVPAPGDLQPMPISDTLSRIDRRFERPHLAARYRGAWLDRWFTLHARELGELVEPVKEEGVAGLLDRLDALYADSLPQLLKEESDLDQEVEQIEGLLSGRLKAVGGVLRVRGQPVERRDLPEMLATVSGEREAVRRRLRAHDRAVRGCHLAAARRLGGGHEGRLRSMLALLHYAEHAHFDLSDAREHQRNVLAVVLADGSISASEMARLVGACQEVFASLTALFEERHQVDLPADVRARFPVEGWSQVWPSVLGLPEPGRGVLAKGWLGVMEQRVDLTLHILQVLREHTLDALVTAEAEVEAALRGGTALPPFAGPAVRPPPRVRRSLGEERPIQTRLDLWDRFVNASGPLPTFARLTAALAVLAPTVLLTASSGGEEVVRMAVWNGYGVPVQVRVDDERPFRIMPDSLQTVTVSAGDHVVQADVPNTDMKERLTVTVPEGADVVGYNVLGGSALYAWTAVYGSGREPAPKMLGAQRWVASGEDAIFSRPPASVKGSEGKTERRVAVEVVPGGPAAQFDSVPDRSEAVALAIRHVRLDPPASAETGAWVQLALTDPAGQQAFADRLAADPDNLMLRRVELAVATPESRDALCSQHRAAAAADPDDPDTLALDLLCRSSQEDTTEAALAAVSRFPDHILLRASALRARSGLGDWEAARALAEGLLADRAAVRALGDRLRWSVLQLRRLASPNPEEAAFRDLFAVGSGPARLHRSSKVDQRLAYSPVEQGFQALQTGDLAEAWRKGVNGERSAEQAMLVVRIACSTGATPEMIDRAMALAPMTEATDLVMLVALARRRGHPDPELSPERRGALDQLFPGWEAALSGERAAIVAGMAEARRRVDGDLFLIGYLATAGVIRLGEEAPPAWRQESAAFLMAPQRPYLGPPVAGD